VPCLLLILSLYSIQNCYPLQTGTLQGFESSCPLLKKDFGKNYCPCPLLKKQLLQKYSSCLLLKKQIKNKYFSCLLFLTTTTLFIPLEMLSKIVPIDNLNYQFIVDTDDSKWAAAKDEIQKIIPPTSSLYVSTLNDWVEAYNEKLLNYRMPVYIFIMFIGVFGIINLLNTLITNILTRKRELGVLQAVGLSSKQLSKMLLIEGLFYTLGVLLLSISCGTLIGYLLCTVFSAMSIFGKVSYHFPTVEMFSYFILMLAVQMLFSCFAIRQIKKQSLVDQIRELS